MKTKSRILLFLLVFGHVLFVVGCSHDADPNAKIDAPGYYNGPMKSHGGNQKGTGSGSTE